MRAQIRTGGLKKVDRPPMEAGPVGGNAICASAINFCSSPAAAFGSRWSLATSLITRKYSVVTSSGNAWSPFTNTASWSPKILAPSEIKGLLAVGLGVLVDQICQNRQDRLLDRRRFQEVEEFRRDVRILALRADVVVLAEPVEPLPSRWERERPRSQQACSRP